MSKISHSANFARVHIERRGALSSAPHNERRIKNEKELNKLGGNLVLPSHFQRFVVAFLALGSHLYPAQQDSVRWGHGVGRSSLLLVGLTDSRGSHPAGLCHTFPRPFVIIVYHRKFCLSITFFKKFLSFFCNFCRPGN